MTNTADLLRRIVNGDGRSKESLKNRKDKAPIEASRGSADYAEASGGGGSLTEPDYTRREYHPESAIYSSDGLFAIMIEPIKKIYYEDISGTEVIIEDDQPV